jgi:hypothetical protein
MNDQIQKYLDVIHNDFARWYGIADVNHDFANERLDTFKKELRFEVGNKFIKIISGTSVHSFIVKEDEVKFKKGDILKAATWKAPAKNFARGNIINEDFGQVRWTGA